MPQKLKKYSPYLHKFNNDYLNKENKELSSEPFKCHQKFISEDVNKPKQNLINDQIKNEVKSKSKHIIGSPMIILKQRLKLMPEMDKKIIRRTDISYAKAIEQKSNLLLERRKENLMKNQEKFLKCEKEMEPFILDIHNDDLVNIIKLKLGKIGLTENHLARLNVSDYEVLLLATPFTQLLNEVKLVNRPLTNLVHRLGLSITQLVDLSIQREDLNKEFNEMSLGLLSSNAMTYKDRINLLEQRAKKIMTLKEREFRKNLERTEDEMVAATFAKNKLNEGKKNSKILPKDEINEITSDTVLLPPKKPPSIPEVPKLNSKDDITPLVRYLRAFPPPLTPEAKVTFISQLEQRIEDARADEEGLDGPTRIPANRPYHKLCEIDLARTLTDPAIKSNTKLSMLFMKLSGMGVTRTRLRKVNIRPAELIGMLFEFRRLAQYGASCSQVRACSLRCEDLSQAGVPCFELRRGLRFNHLEAFGLTLARLEQLGITSKDLRGMGMRGVPGEHRPPRTSLTAPVNVLIAPPPTLPSTPPSNTLEKRNFAKPSGNYAFNRERKRYTNIK